MSKNRIYILFICIAIAAIVMLWDSSQEILTPPRGSVDDGSKFPYAVAKDASTQHFNKKGALDYAFTANRLEHYRVEKNRNAIEEYTLIRAPSFTLYDKQSPWHIEANQGRLQRTPDKIDLWDQVKIWQFPQSESTSNIAPIATELTTASLSIDLIEKVAHTEDAVRILSSYGTIEAVGMTADFQKRKINLLNGVRAIHKIPAQAK